ncbi:hypothetical protein LCGC14_2855620 [marine sediment metagenome]|uniref:Uncharacterized protein n=1 Tax=marine sediment metagenome TaxID=412755 RepID=A0A0F9AY14_9ZZZZ
MAVAFVITPDQFADDVEELNKELSQLNIKWQNSFRSPTKESFDFWKLSGSEGDINFFVNDIEGAILYWEHPFPLT